MSAADVLAVLRAIDTARAVITALSRPGKFRLHLQLGQLVVRYPLADTPAAAAAEPRAWTFTPEMFRAWLDRVSDGVPVAQVMVEVELGDCFSSFPNP